jgi:large subunit ribosomal protein L19
MGTVIDTIERDQLRRVPRFQAGDRLKVHFQVIEGTRRRTQVFEGVAIKRQGHGVRETFTVRKQSFGVVRRAKLYYLRDRVGKAARVRERGYVGPEEVVEPGLVTTAAASSALADDGAPAEDTVAEAGTEELSAETPIDEAPAGAEQPTDVSQPESAAQAEGGEPAEEPPAAEPAEETAGAEPAGESA